MDVRRQGRMAEEMKRLLSGIIAREVKDPRLGFWTITRVVLSRDLQIATVHVSVLGDTLEASQTIRILDHVRGYLRREVGRQLGVRITPELHFKLDHSIEEGSRVLRLMDELPREAGGEPSESTPPASEPWDGPQREPARTESTP